MDQWDEFKVNSVGLRHLSGQCVRVELCRWLISSGCGGRRWVRADTEVAWHEFRLEMRTRDLNNQDARAKSSFPFARSLLPAAVWLGAAAAAPASSC